MHYNSNCQAECWCFKSKHKDSVSTVYKTLILLFYILIHHPWVKENIVLIPTFLRILVTKLESNLCLVFLSPSSSRAGGCIVQCAVGAGAGSYFLKIIHSRGQLATNNCQFLRLARRSSEENQQGRERESAWATPRAHQAAPPYGMADLSPQKFQG